MPDSGPMTRNQATNMLDRLDHIDANLTIAQDASASAEANSKTTQRLVKWVIGGFAVAFSLLLVALVALALIVQNNKSNQKTACESGNRRVDGNRAAIQAEWERDDAVAEATGYAQDSALRIYYRDYRDWELGETQPFRDCENLSEPIPIPGPPPTFAEALDEALERESIENSE